MLITGVPLVRRVSLALACAVALVGVAAPDASAAARHFANCTAMHKVYKHGVGQVHAHDHVSGKSKPVTNFTHSNALYAANKGLDRDKDKVACEAR